MKFFCNIPKRDIAKKFHTTVENIVTTNELPGEQVKTGQRLLLVKEVGV